mmetsp:Transcript_14843/g.34121  ORF Transcript_14843/g.34121 Transcript_14843/m.34121 type:complete len:122 (-) Transcript_14843:570-935(-)
MSHNLGRAPGDNKSPWWMRGCPVRFLYTSTSCDAQAGTFPSFRPAVLSASQQGGSKGAECPAMQKGSARLDSELLEMPTIDSSKTRMLEPDRGTGQESLGARNALKELQKTLHRDASHSSA